MRTVLFVFLLSLFPVSSIASNNVITDFDFLFSCESDSSVPESQAQEFKVALSDAIESNRQLFEFPDYIKGVDFEIEVVDCLFNSQSFLVFHKPGSPKPTACSTLGCQVYYRKPFVYTIQIKSSFVGVGEKAVDWMSLHSVAYTVLNISQPPTVSLDTNSYSYGNNQQLLKFMEVESCLLRVVGEAVLAYAYLDLFGIDINTASDEEMKKPFEIIESLKAESRTLIDCRGTT